MLIVWRTSIANVLRGLAPLDNRQRPLMLAWSEFGRLFHAKRADRPLKFLQSAEAERPRQPSSDQFMEKRTTVDVAAAWFWPPSGLFFHDHRKNLVEIIVENMGTTWVKLGIKVPPEDFIKPYHSLAGRHRPFGLLVKKSRSRCLPLPICAT